jgi:putative membrane protein
MGTTLLLAKILIALIAIIHCYILVLEMFLWTTRGPKVFKSIPKTLFEPTRKLAANQGLYNGFLAAGLFWSFLISDPEWSAHIAQFFLGCIAIAGLYGSITAQRSILYIQTLPATLAIILLLVS